MKQTYSVLALAGLLALAVTPAPLRAAGQEGEPAMVASLDQNDLSLYFDQAELKTVESATRAPKPITQAAENISIITAQDIERWNAHSLQDVLAHVPGVHIDSFGRDVNNFSAINIQGYDFREVQLYLDGIRFNDPASDYNMTTQIPVEIIERIEVIKGPASSTWGSAMGGIVNIITKGAGTSATPSGAITTSLGERQTERASVQVAGLAGPAGYFLHAGALDSDGQLDDRWLESDSQYAKLSAPLPGQTTLTVSMGRFHPNSVSLFWKNFNGLGDNITSRWNETSRFATATLARPLGEHLHLQLYGSLLDKYYTNNQDILSPAVNTSIWEYTEDQEENSGAVRLYGDLGRHSLSLGAETSRTAFDENLFGVQGQHTFTKEAWALYANDTIHWGRATITPGLRYDSNSIADTQISPSLGLTWRLTSDTLLRALAARGFMRPAMIDKYSNFFFTPPPDLSYQANLDLNSETVHTYQAGIESTALSPLRLKATLFRHEVDQLWAAPPAGSTLNYINSGSQARNGIELEAETGRWRGLALIANHSYVNFQPENDAPDPGSLALSNLIFDYEGPWGLNGRLSGNYTWLTDKSAPPGRGGTFDDMNWDLTATKVIRHGERYRFDLFASAHNLFNGSQYSVNMLVNADRWLEAGLRCHF